MKTSLKTQKTYTLEFTEAEFALFINGIGVTNQCRLEEAGLTAAQAKFLSNTYSSAVADLGGQDQLPE